MNIKKTRNRGFTLIEMMIVVAIIAILSVIAFPSYQRYVLRSHRVDARNMLMDAAQKLQQNYSISRSWDKLSGGATIDNNTLATWGLNRSPASGETRYNINFVRINESGYELQAIPQGVQQKDTCGTFTISNTNAKTANGEGARSQLSINCWRG